VDTETLALFFSCAKSVSHKSPLGDVKLAKRACAPLPAGLSGTAANPGGDSVPSGREQGERETDMAARAQAGFNEDELRMLEDIAQNIPD
jgi:hypothetical protein